MPLDAVAVTVQLPATVGATNTPALEIDPQLAVHVTGWLAVNVCVFIACRFTTAGMIVIGELTVTEAESGLPPEGVAVIVQDPAVRGAVKSPVMSIEPQLAVQVALPLAVNCCVAPSLTVAVVGDIVNPPDEPMVSVALAL